MQVLDTRPFGPIERDILSYLHVAGEAGFEWRELIEHMNGWKGVPPAKTSKFVEELAQMGYIDCIVYAKVVDDEVKQVLRYTLSKRGQESYDTYLKGTKASAEKA